MKKSHFNLNVIRTDNMYYGNETNNRSAKLGGRGSLGDDIDSSWQDEGQFKVPRVSFRFQMCFYIALFLYFRTLKIKIF